MEISHESLKDRYLSEDSEELLTRHSTGALTNEAYAALEEVLKDRGVVVPDRPTENIEVKKINVFSTNKYLLITIAIIAFVTWSTYRGQGREERLDKAVDNANQTIGANAYNEYLLGNEISTSEFVIAANQIVKETNSQLPILIDEATTIESVDFKKNSLIYNYKLKIKKDQTNPSLFHDEIYNNLIQTVCNDKVAIFFLKHNINVIYSYTLKNGDDFTKINFSREECKL